MAENKVSIIITAKNKASEVVSSMSKGIKADFVKLKSFVKDHWKGIAASLAGVSAAIAAGIYKITRASMVQEDAEERLLHAMKQVGEYTPEAYKEMLQYASAMQEVSRYGDEAILPLMANLRAYGMTTDQLKSATKAVLDLSAAKKMDLMAASELVGKAFVGETQSLSRYGLMIDDNIEKGEKFAEVIKLISERFGGSALSETETYRGKLERLKNAWGDLLEKLGDAITKSEAGTSSLDKLYGVVKKITDFIEEHETAVRIVVIGTAIAGVATATGGLVLILGKLLPLLLALGALGPVGIVAGLLAAGAAGAAGLGAWWWLSRQEGLSRQEDPVQPDFERKFLNGKWYIGGEVPVKWGKEPEMKMDWTARVAADSEKAKSVYRDFLEKAKSVYRDFCQFIKDSSAEAAQHASGNFSNYFFDLFTGKIRTLKDLWMGFCQSIFNAWARTMANIAAEKTVSTLFSTGLSMAGGFGGGGGVTTSTPAAIKSYPGLGGGASRMRSSDASAAQQAPQVTINIVNPMDEHSVRRMIAREGETVVRTVISNYLDNGPMRSMVAGGLA